MPVPLTQSRLRELLDYDPETGVFTWKPKPVRSAVHFTYRRADERWNTLMAGKTAGALDGGYIRIKIDDHSFRAHRLAWLWMTGEWPPEGIDHKDTVKTNNRFDNLRPATPVQNGANRRTGKNNTSGFKGVWLDRGRWRASLRHDGRRLHLGMFATLEDASAAYEAKARDLSGEFARAA